MTQPVLTDLTKTTFDPELSPGASNAVNTCLRIQPSEKVTLITDNACREIAASLAAGVDQAGLALQGVCAGRSGAASADRSAGRDCRRHGNQRCQHLRRPRAAQRAEVAHADDRHREPPQDAARPHGQHQQADHAGRHARRLQQGGCAQPQSDGHRHPSQRDSRHQSGGQRFHGEAQSRTTTGSRPAASSAATSGAIFPAAKSLPRRET